MAVSPDQLATLLAPDTGRLCSTCTPPSVCPDHRSLHPDGPVTCRASCGEPLDPALWQAGLHALCTDPAAPPPPPVEQPTLFSAPAGTRPGADHPLKTELINIVRWAVGDAPRTRQVQIGPSELGVDCMRRLAYRFTGTQQVNTTADPWFSVVGTAVHDWLATAIDQYNAKVLGPPSGTRSYAQRRYLVEERVTVSSDEFGLSGSCDLYDTDRATVIDHKIVGAAALRKYTELGPSNQYRVQVHTYGYGHELAGRAVREVAIAFYPRSGYLTDLHVWAEPYNQQIALDALHRAGSIRQLAAALPAALIPAHPDPAACTWCPFYRPGGPADTTGCPGPT